MNYILLFLILFALFKLTGKKENFKVKTCMDCRKELSLKKENRVKKLILLKLLMNALMKLIVMKMICVIFV